MPHVTFVHGISNKPAPAEMLRAWNRFLANEDGLALATEGVTTSAVYWADVLYAEPLGDTVAYASAQADGPEPGPSLAEEQRTYESLPEPERMFIEALAAEIGVEPVPPSTDAGEAQNAGAKERGGRLERFPLPWPVKRKLMRVLLRDVHHYLFDTTYEPRPGEVFEVQTEIRRRFVRDLEAVTSSGPHLVVSHSMGTVIAYDCLMRVSGCPRVDGLMTLGSPLGLDTIQDKLRPEWSRDNGFPELKVRGDWVNVSDRLDPVCGFDPEIANDFLKARLPAVVDMTVENPGMWKHSVSKYFAQESVRDRMVAMLDI